MKIYYLSPSSCFQHSDMNEEMRTEAMELCVTACEKFSTNNEVSIHPSSLINLLSHVTLNVKNDVWYLALFANK